MLIVFSFPMTACIVNGLLGVTYFGFLHVLVIFIVLGIAADDITAFVIDDPDAVFLVDADAAFTRADLYKNYSVTNTTGVTATGISKAQLDVSVSGITATFAIQAIDISQDPENSDTSTSNANILVRINNHFYRSGTGIA